MTISTTAITAHAYNSQSELNASQNLVKREGAVDSALEDAVAVEPE